MTENSLYSEISYKHVVSLEDNLKKGYHTEIQFTQKLIERKRNPFLMLIEETIQLIKLTQEAWWDPYQQKYLLQKSNGEIIFYDQDQIKELEKDFFSFSYRFYFPRPDNSKNSEYIIKARAKWKKIQLYPPVNILYIIPFYLVDHTGWETFAITEESI